MTQKEGRVSWSECSAPVHQCLFLTGQLCTWTKGAQLHWFFGSDGGKPSSHPHDDPLQLCTAITSLRLEAIVRRKKNVFMSPGHSSTGCWQQQQQKQSGWKRSWSKKWYYQDTSYESLSPALCKSLTPSLPLASQRSPSDSWSNTQKHSLKFISRNKTLQGHILHVWCLGRLAPYQQTTKASTNHRNLENHYRWAWQWSHPVSMQSRKSLVIPGSFCALNRSRSCRAYFKWLGWHGRSCGAWRECRHGNTVFIISQMRM